MTMRQESTSGRGHSECKGPEVGKLVSSSGWIGVDEGTQGRV